MKLLQAPVEAPGAVPPDHFAVAAVELSRVFRVRLLVEMSLWKEVACLYV